jgi:hypothetical protein
LKKIIVLGFLFFIMLVFAGAALFLKQFPDSELATISASVGNPDDCEIGGSSNVKAVGTVVWWYYNLPGVSQSYVDSGNSFLSSAFDALICKEGQAGYSENTRRIKRLVLHAKKYGESINHKGENGFNLLHGAIIHGDISLIKFLIKEGADVTSLTSKDAVWYAKSYDGLTPYQLGIALRKNQWPVSDEIIEFLRKADNG